VAFVDSVEKENFHKKIEEQSADTPRSKKKECRYTNLKANLTEGAPLLITPSLHTFPVSILHAWTQTIAHL
jgi:hypothetical protein